MKTQFELGVEKSGGDSGEFAYNLFSKWKKPDDISYEKTLMEFGATAKEAANSVDISNLALYRKLEKSGALTKGLDENATSTETKKYKQEIMKAYGFDGDDLDNVLTPNELMKRAVVKREASHGTMSPLTIQEAKRKVLGEIWEQEEMGTGEFITKSLRVSINSAGRILNRVTGIGDKEEIDIKLYKLNNALNSDSLVDDTFLTAMTREALVYSVPATIMWSPGMKMMNLAKTAPVRAYFGLATIDYLTGYTVGSGRNPEEQKLMSPNQEGLLNAAIPGTIGAWKTLAHMAKSGDTILFGMSTKDASDYIVKQLGLKDDLAREIPQRWAELSADKTMTDEAKLISIIEAAGGSGAHIKQRAMALDNDISGNINRSISDFNGELNNLINEGNIDKFVLDIVDFDKKAKDTYTKVYDTIKETNNQQINLRVNTINALLDEVNDELALYPNTKMIKLRRKLETLIELNGEGIPLSNVLDIVHDIGGIKTTGTKSSKMKQQETLGDIKQYLNGILDENLVPELRDSLNIARQMYKDKFKLIDNNKLVSEIYKYIGKDNPGKIKNALNLATNLNGEDLRAVLGILGPKKASNLESAIIKNLVGTHTKGTNDINSIINLGKINNKLKDYPFKTETGKALAEVITNLSKAFTTDKMVRGSEIFTPSSASTGGMTSDLVQKAKYSIMAKVWRTLTANEDYAFIRRVAKVYGKDKRKVELSIDDYRKLDEAKDTAFKAIKEEREKIVNNIDGLSKDKVELHLASLGVAERGLNNSLNASTQLSKSNSENIITVAKGMKDDVNLDDESFDIHLNDLREKLKSADSNIEREWLIEQFENDIKRDKPNKSSSIKSSTMTEDDFNVYWAGGKSIATVSGVTGATSAYTVYEDTGSITQATGAFIVGSLGGALLGKAGANKFNKSIGSTSGTFFTKGTKLNQGVMVDPLYTDVNLKPLNLWGKNDKTLGDVLIAPELFKQRPELRDIPIKIGDENAYYTPIKGSIKDSHIVISKDGINNVKASLRNTVHETQHGIQQLDDLPKGTNLKDSTPKQYREATGEQQSILVEGSLGKGRGYNLKIIGGLNIGVSNYSSNMYWDIDKMLETLSDKKKLKLNNVLGMMTNKGAMVSSLDFLEIELRDQVGEDGLLYKLQIKEALSRLRLDKSKTDNYGNSYSFEEFPTTGYIEEVYKVPEGTAIFGNIPDTDIRAENISIIDKALWNVRSPTYDILIEKIKRSFDDSLSVQKFDSDETVKSINKLVKKMEGKDEKTMKSLADNFSFTRVPRAERKGEVPYNMNREVHIGPPSTYMHIRKTEDDNTVYLFEIQADAQKDKKASVPFRNTWHKLALMDQISDTFEKGKNVEVPIKGWGFTQFRNKEADVLYDTTIRKEITKLSKKMNFKVDSKILPEEGFKRPEKYIDSVDHYPPVADVKKDLNSKSGSIRKFIDVGLGSVDSTDQDTEYILEVMKSDEHLVEIMGKYPLPKFMDGYGLIKLAKNMEEEKIVSFFKGIFYEEEYKAKYSFTYDIIRNSSYTVVNRLQSAGIDLEDPIFRYYIDIETPYSIYHKFYEMTGTDMADIPVAQRDNFIKLLKDDDIIEKLNTTGTIDFNNDNLNNLKLSNINLDNFTEAKSDMLFWIKSNGDKLEELIDDMVELSGKEEREILVISPNKKEEWKYER